MRVMTLIESLPDAHLPTAYTILIAFHAVARLDRQTLLDAMCHGVDNNATPA